MTGQFKSIDKVFFEHLDKCNLPEIDKLLAYKCININMRNDRGYTPLHLAVQLGCIPMVELFLREKNIIVDNLAYEMASDRPEVLRPLVEYHKNLGRRTDKRAGSGHTPAGHVCGPWQSRTEYCAAVGGTVLKWPRPFECCAAPFFVSDEGFWERTERRFRAECVRSPPSPPPRAGEVRGNAADTVTLAGQQAVDPTKDVIRRSMEGLPGCSQWTDDVIDDYAAAMLKDDHHQTVDSSTAVTSSHTVGVAGVDGQMVVMVEKHTPVPVTRSVEFLAENLARTVTIYAGDSVYAEKNAVVGELTLYEPPMYDAGRRAEVHVIVTVTVDADGCFTAGRECRAVRHRKKRPRRSGTCSYGRVNYFPASTDYNCRYSVPAVDA